MREVEKDPEERRKRRLAEDVFLGDSNTLDHFKKRKKVGRPVEGNPMGEGPSGLQGTSDSVSFVTVFHWFNQFTWPTH